MDNTSPTTATPSANPMPEPQQAPMVPAPEVQVAAPSSGPKKGFLSKFMEMMGFGGDSNASTAPASAPITPVEPNPAPLTPEAAPAPAAPEAPASPTPETPAVEITDPNAPKPA